MYIHCEKLGGAVQPWPSQAGSGGSGGLQFKGEGSSQGGLLRLEKDALSFLHPRVVLHQLRVEEWVLGDAVLNPLYQALWTDRESRDIFKIPEEVYYYNPSSVHFAIQGKKDRRL